MWAYNAKIKARDAAQAEEKKQEFLSTLSDLKQSHPNQDSPLFHAAPTASLYFVIQNMQGKTSPDPEVTPIEAAPLIPMYDAFVKTIAILWSRASLYNVGKKPIFDFLFHRAAYMLVTGSCCRTGAVFHTAKTFIAAVKERAGTNPMHRSMVGMLKDHYENAGLGWDSTLLSNEDTYTAEMWYADYYGVAPRNELFRSFCYRKGLLNFQMQREEQKHLEAAEMAERERLNVNTGKSKRSGSKSKSVSRGVMRSIER